MTSTDNVSAATQGAAPVEAREKASGPRSRKGAATRARLIEAAKAVFEDDGFLDARISDIAERAGLSHGSFYHYFDSKEQVFREVAMTIGENLQRPVYSVIFDAASTASPADRLRAGIRSFLSYYQAEARIIGVIEMVSRYDPTLTSTRFEFQEPNRERGAGSIASLQRRGLVDSTLDPMLALSALGAMMNGFAEKWFVQRLFDLEFEAGVEQLTKLCLNALGLSE
jgi:AcrR family transcriptional regulator